MRCRRVSIICCTGPNAYLRSTKNVIAKQTIVQIISPGVTEISGLAAIIPLHQHVGEDRAEQSVEDDRLGQREAEPLDALQLAAQLGLAGDGLDHRAEDVADADTGAERAEADAEREANRLAGLRHVARRCREKGGHAVFLL